MPNSKNSAQNNTGEKHYNVDALFLYSHGFLNEADAFTVDLHLMECESCRNLFFRLLEEEGAVQEAEKQVPEHFTHTVMQKIAAEPSLKLKKAPAKPLNRRQYIAAYAAVACLTLFLSWNGVFSPIAQAGEELPKERPAPITQKYEKINQAMDTFFTNIQQSSDAAKANIQKFLNGKVPFQGEKQAEDKNKR